MTDRCKSCNAEIIWAEIDGKSIPLNKRRVRAYRPNEMRDGEFRQLMGPDGDKPYLVHISHFITCPQASEHSGGGMGWVGKNIVDDAKREKDQ